MVGGPKIYLIFFSILTPNVPKMKFLGLKMKELLFAAYTLPLRSIPLKSEEEMGVLVLLWYFPP